MYTYIDRPRKPSGPVSMGHFVPFPTRPPVARRPSSSRGATFVAAQSATPDAWDRRSTARARAAVVFFSSSALRDGTPRPLGSNVGSEPRMLKA